MTLEQIYYIAEIFAVVGILISLVLVLVQLRQTQDQIRENTRATKINTELAVSNFGAEMQVMLIENPMMMDAAIKARNNDPDMTPRERALYYTYLNMIVNTAFFSVSAYWFDGHIANNIHYRVAQASKAIDCDLGRKWLMRNRDMFDSDFSRWLDGIAGLGPLVEPLPPGNFPPPKRHDVQEGVGQ